MVPVDLLRRTQPPLPWSTIVAAGIGAAVTIAVLGALTDLTSVPLLAAAFGSSCVLVFAFPDAPFSRPLNVVGGHVVSAASGLAVGSFLPPGWWSMGLAVGLAVVAMTALRVTHPPAGGVPVVILTAHATWSYLVTPVLAGAVLVVALGLVHAAVMRRARRAGRGADAGDTAASSRSARPTRGVRERS